MESQKIAILGYSEAALTMIFDILESQPDCFEVLVVNNLKLDPKPQYVNHNITYKIIDYLPEDYNGNYLIGPINVNNKLKVFHYYNLHADQFINIRHHSVIISGSTKIGSGCIINAGVVIAGQSFIEDFVYLNRSIAIGHHTKIGNFTTVNPACNIAGNVTIGEQCQIGMGTTIIDGLKIGNNTLIGAGSLVLKDIPDHVIAYGNPCMVIRENILS